MRRLKIALIALALLYPGYSFAEVYLNVYSQTLKVGTGLRKTTGLWGRLAGHFSKADENQLIKETQKGFRQLYPNRSGLVQLPTSVEYQSIMVSPRRRFSQEGLLGGVKINEYRSFSAKARVVIPFLSEKLVSANAGSGVLVSKANLLVYFNDNLVGSLGFDDPAQLFSKIKFKNDMIGETKIALPAAIRFHLGKKLGIEHLDPNIERVSLRLQMNMQNKGTTVVRLKDWDKANLYEFANLFFISKSRLINPKYYTALCSSLLASSK